MVEKIFLKHIAKSRLEKLAVKWCCVSIIPISWKFIFCGLVIHDNSKLKEHNLEYGASLPTGYHTRFMALETLWLIVYRLYQL